MNMMVREYTPRARIQVRESRYNTVLCVHSLLEYTAKFLQILSLYRWFTNLSTFYGSFFYEVLEIALEVFKKSLKYWLGHSRKYANLEKVCQYLLKVVNEEDIWSALVNLLTNYVEH